MEEAEKEGALAEFVALRDEILDLGNKRQGLYLFQAAASGAVLSFCAADSSHYYAGLILPVLSLQFGSRYFSYGLHSVKIARYIRDILSPRVPGGLGWESWQSNLPSVNPWVGKYYHHLLVFLGPAIVGWMIGVWGAATHELPVRSRWGLSFLCMLSLLMVSMILLSWQAHERMAERIWAETST